MKTRLLIASLAPLALGACNSSESHGTAGSASTEAVAGRSVAVKVTGMT